MEKNKIQQRINDLKKELQRYDYAYYVLDRPETSDAIYDSLKRELLSLEEKFPEFITPDSPTQRVSGKPLDKFVKFNHRTPMLSLQDAKTVEEVGEWEERIMKLLNPQDNLDYFVELKMDGLAVTLIYEDGIFIKGATRGDGLIGEDITQNLKTIKSIPLKLNIEDLEKKAPQTIKEKIIEIRGEVFINQKAFLLLNKEQERNKQLPFANPRNAAAGSLRQLDSQIVANRQLDFYGYQIVTEIGQKTHQDAHKFLKVLGFKDNSYNQFCSNLKLAVAFKEKISKLRNQLPYEIDGIVITVNNNDLFKKLGSVGKNPRGALAFKFPAMEATTRVKDIIVQVGRTGRLTPVAILEPVNLSGVVISRATLHNQDEIERLGIKIGDTVVVERAGDVIPAVTQVLVNLRTNKEKPFKMPSLCPICGGKSYRKPGEVDYYCSNKKCYATLRRQICHFVSRRAFDIEHLGPQIINQLLAAGLIRDRADLFSLKKEDLLSLERFAEKSADNLIRAVAKAKNVNLSRLLFSLGIRHVGEETATLLTSKIKEMGYVIDNINQLIKFFTSQSADDWQKISTIGPISAESLAEWFSQKENINLLMKLYQLGVKIENINSQTTTSRLANKKFVLTGSLQSMSRDQAKDRIRELGGNISESVSSKTDFLVAGDEPGSKYNQAKKLNVKIISEDDFLNLLK